MYIFNANVVRFFVSKLGKRFFKNVIVKIKSVFYKQEISIVKSGLELRV